MNLNPEKLAKLHNTNDLLTQKYGEKGTNTRIAFEERAMANYYAEIFKEKRKELQITQQQLAERVGKKREYIALLEKGETDMQLSTFIFIARALGMRFSLV